MDHGEYVGTKLLATLIWDARAIIQIDNRQQSRTIKIMIRKRNDLIWPRSKCSSTETMKGCRCTRLRHLDCSLILYIFRTQPPVTIFSFQIWEIARRKEMWFQRWNKPSKTPSLKTSTNFSTWKGSRSWRNSEWSVWSFKETILRINPFFVEKPVVHTKCHGLFPIIF